MPTLKGNLHTHSTLSDGWMTPDEVVRAYRELEYDFIAFTDHRCMIGPPGAEHDYWSRLPASGDHLLVLHGVEEEPEILGGRHVGVIHAPDGETLRILNHPNQYALTLAEVVEAISAVDAHAVEVSCHGRYLEQYDTDLIPVPGIVSDDAHYPVEIGVAWIEVESERTASAILRAIKKGDFENYVGGQRV